MDHCFLQEPSQRVKSYRLRKFNLGISTILWLISLILYPRAKQLIARREVANTILRHNRGNFHELYAEQGRQNAKKAAKEAKNLFAVVWSTTLLATTWTLYQSYYSLVRAAEQEIFGELLNNWQTDKHYVPTQLIPVFEEALSMRENKPKNFAQKLPSLIELIKEQTERHKKDAHYFAISRSLEKLNNTLPKHQTAPYSTATLDTE